MRILEILREHGALMFACAFIVWCAVLGFGDLIPPEWLGGKGREESSGSDASDCAIIDGVRICD